MLSGRMTLRLLLYFAVVACIALVAMQPSLFSRWAWGREIATGLMVGTYFGVISLSAAWMAVGFGPRIARIWQSLAPCAIALVALVVNFLLGPMLGYELPVIVAVCGLAALGQWLLAVGTLSSLVTARNIRLRHASELSTDVAASDQQFGIRELLLATAGTAALLGAIRWLVQSHSTAPDVSMIRGLVIFGYVVACNVFVVIPLLVGPLLRRFAGMSTLLALTFVAIVTSCEIAAFRHFKSVSNETVVFWTINYVQAMWIVLVLGTVRAGGYRLAGAKTTDLAAAIAVH